MKPQSSAKILLASSILAFIVAGCSNTGTTSTTTVTVPATPEASAPATTPDEKARAFVRGVHVVPGVGPLDVVPLDVKSNESTGDIKEITYGNASQFIAVRPGKYKIYAQGSDGKSKSGPMPVTLESGEDMTVVVNGVPGDIAMLPFKHKNGGPLAGRAKVAFMHAAKALPAVEVIIDGTRYRGGVKYGVATDYRELSPGRHTMQIVYDKSLAPIVVTQQPVELPEPAPQNETATNTTVNNDGSNVMNGDTVGENTTRNTINNTVTENTTTLPTPTPVKTIVKPKERVTLTQQLDLSHGKVYSVVVFHDSARLPKLRLLEDKFAAELKRAPSTATSTR